MSCRARERRNFCLNVFVHSVFLCEPQPLSWEGQAAPTVLGPMESCGAAPPRSQNCGGQLLALPPPPPPGPAAMSVASEDGWCHVQLDITPYFSLESRIPANPESKKYTIF